MATVDEVDSEVLEFYAIVAVTCPDDISTEVANLPERS